MSQKFFFWKIFNFFWNYLERCRIKFCDFLAQWHFFITGFVSKIFAFFSLKRLYLWNKGLNPYGPENQKSLYWDPTNPCKISAHLLPVWNFDFWPLLQKTYSKLFLRHPLWKKTFLRCLSSINMNLETYFECSN